MKKVLITRPHHSALTTSHKLLDLGYQPLFLPLSTMIPLEPRVDHVRKATLLTITSANAIRFSPPSLLALLAERPLYAVGKTSAKSAEVAGFSKVFSGNREAETLAALIHEKCTQQIHILYLCGRIRRPHFENILKRYGYGIDVLETYDTLPLDHSDAEVLATTNEDVPHFVLLYSLCAAEALRTLLMRSLPAKLLSEACFCCMSERIAKALPPSHEKKIRIAETPNEASLLSLLQKKT